MRRPFTIKVPERIAQLIRSLHPELRRSVRAAIDEISANPAAGGRLEGELGQYWEYRVRRYRLVYSIDRSARVIRIVALGHRGSVYEDVAAQLKSSRE